MKNRIIRYTVLCTVIVLLFSSCSGLFSNEKGSVSFSIPQEAVKQMFSRGADIAEGSKSIGFSYSSIYIKALIETEGGIVARQEKTVSIESMDSSSGNVSFTFEGLDIEPIYTITINCYALLDEQREQMEMRTMFSV